MAEIRETPAMRLKLARVVAGYKTAKAFSDKFGVPQPTYSMHESGERSILGEVAQKYAGWLGVRVVWLERGEGEMRAGGTAALRAGLSEPGGGVPALTGRPEPGILEPGILEFGGVEFASIGRYDASFSAGPGSLVEPDARPLDYQLVTRDWLKSLTLSAPDLLAIVRVKGDSMTPTLLDGDWVLVDKAQRRVSQEGIYALRVFEDSWIKRISLNLRDRLVRIISDNPVVPMQELPEAEIDVIGRVISLVSRRMP
jgi:phage repressor protein C with HTH and peptisase S24 domain